MENNKELLELKHFYITSIINDIYLYIICDKIFKNKYVEDIINDFTIDLRHPTSLDIFDSVSNRDIFKILHTIEFKDMKIRISKNFILSDSDEYEYLENIIKNLNSIFSKYTKDYEYGKITDTNVKIEHLINNDYIIHFSFIFDSKYDFNLNNNSVVDIVRNRRERK